MNILLGMFLAATLTAGETARLTQGEVIVDVERSADGEGGAVDAWIDIAAPPQLVWDTMTDCDHAASFVPNLVSCRVIDRDPKGAWEVLEHVGDPGWLLPNMRSRFRADLAPPREMRFAQVDGDFEVMKGKWTLSGLAEGQTRLRYEAQLKPRVWLPEFVIEHVIETDAPRNLRALRDEVLRRKGLVAPR